MDGRGGGTGGRELEGAERKKVRCARNGRSVRACVRACAPVKRGAAAALGGGRAHFLCSAGARLAHTRAHFKVGRARTRTNEMQARSVWKVHGCASAHCSVGDAVAVAFAAAIDDDINKNWLNAKKEGEKWKVVDDALAN